MAKNGKTYYRLLRSDPCSYCGVMPAGTVDHIEPTSLGGLDDWTNWAAACERCNAGKGTRSVLEVMLGVDVVKTNLSHVPKQNRERWLRALKAQRMRQKKLTQKERKAAWRVARSLMAPASRLVTLVGLSRVHAAVRELNARVSTKKPPAWTRN